jgi:hypothetical protein
MLIFKLFHNWFTGLEKKAEEIKPQGASDNKISVSLCL